MSEKIYAWLLRLHSARFRRAYGEEALQLFRDRARDEKGFFERLRLWLDLLGDLAISVPRGYRNVQPELIGAPAQGKLDGIPTFRVLGSELPRRGALLLGGVLSLVNLAAFVSVSHFGGYRSSRTSVFETLRLALQADPGTNNPAVAQKVKLEARKRQRIIHSIIANLKEHYIDPGVAQKIAEALLAHENNGDYEAVTDGPAFAALFTRQLRDVSHDMHLELVYSQAPLPNPAGPTPESMARYRDAMQRENCTFEKVEILPHNIGYLKINSFPDPSICGSTATAAMASLNRTDAVIFDLRENGGGYPSMVKLIAAYFFDHPEYLYNPRENTTQESWTESPVPGNKLADKPLYVLTSAKTASGAEQFSYGLKMLKRATLVGETTSGSAHSGVFHRIDEHFGIGIPETRPINPFAKSDWEGTGVEPDVKVKAADALERATKLIAK